MNFPSKLVEAAVTEISSLPGIGKKSALRIALYLLKADVEQTVHLADALKNLRQYTLHCEICHSISDHEKCSICTNKARNEHEICVVEDTKNVLAIENTGQYQGHYHVLDGLIAPMEGVAPSDLNIETLLSRVANNTEKTEIILALSPTMNGDTTAFYIQKKLQTYSHVHITTIARGIPIGGELEYIDEITLGRGINQRIAYK